MLRNVLAAALLYVQSGLSVIPIRLDGSKAPAISEWKSFQSRRPSRDEIRCWPNCGLAIIAGAVSGNLEVFDCDDEQLFDPWCRAVEILCPGLLGKLVIIQTPSGGFHVYYRCPEICGNLKLARKAVEVSKETKDAKLKDGKWVLVKTTLETRGEGGYVLAPDSPGACHPTGRCYRVLFGSFSNIPTITPQERAVMQDAARALNLYSPPERVYKPSSRLPSDRSNRPGDDYNSKSDWDSLLTPHGWTFVYSRGEVSYWLRPGKPAPGISATTNYRGSNLLYVFSSNAYPFEEEASYSLFVAFAMLEFGGDFHAAAKALTEQGYGEPKKRISPPIIGPVIKPARTITLPPPTRPLKTIQLCKPGRPARTILIGEVDK